MMKSRAAFWVASWYRCYHHVYSKKYVFQHCTSSQPCRQVTTVRVSSEHVDKLRCILGHNNVSTALAVREQHGEDESSHISLPADVVVFAQSTNDVVEVAKLCYQNSIPMIPYGTGTGLEHGIGALQGGVCVDLSQMKSILEVNTEDFDATVEAGVQWRSLNHYLRDTGLMFPVDPGADASLGGMASTSASGTNAVRYGTMKENVLNLEVVLADGSVLHTAGKGKRSRKSAAGYNLTNLFVGSEGTLGFITKVTLRLHAIPETMASAVCSFPSVKRAVDCVIQILQSDIPVARIEFMDDLCMGIANKYSKLDYTVEPSLFFEFHGAQGEVEMQSKSVGEIVSSNSGSSFKWAQDPESRSKLWKARHEIFYAILAQKPGNACITTDVCVPISKLTEMIEGTRRDIERSGIMGIMLGHVGDGNFHTVLLYNQQDKGEWQTIYQLKEKIALRALNLDGTCTGEHGIGVGKIDLLEKEYGPIGIQVMRQVKQSLDPKYLMNPGKVFAAPCVQF